MLLLVVVWSLTALAAVVVALTRLRLARPGAAGRVDVGRRLLGVHTGCGVLALGCWVVYLVGESALGEQVVGIVGIAAIGLWWVTVLAGLMVLMRWMPARGRHAAAARQDTWSKGPGLSLLAHGGLTLGVGFFTWVYLVSAA